MTIGRISSTPDTHAGAVTDSTFSAPHEIVDFEKSEVDGNFIQDLEELATFLWRERERQSSVLEQLANPIRKALTGIVINSKDDDLKSTDARNISRLTTLLSTFKDTKKQSYFLNWFSNTLHKRNAKHAIYLLQSLLNTSNLLDLDTYGLIMKNSKKHASLAPLQTLEVASSLLRKNHPKLLDNTFETAYDIFIAQYDNLLTYTKQEIGIKQLLTHNPDATILGMALLDYVDQQITQGSVTLEKGLKATLNYLEIYNAQDIQKFFSRLETRYAQSQAPTQMIRARAIEYNHISSTSEEYQEVINKGKKEILARSIIDAAEINYQHSLKHKAKAKFRILSVSGAPCHRGHLLTIESICERMEELGEFSEDSDTQGFFITAPLLSPKLLEGTKLFEKKASQVGELEPRFWSIETIIRNLKNVEVTTLAQSIPNSEPDPHGWLEFMKSQLTIQVKKANNSIQCEFIRVFGADKVIIKDKKTGDSSIRTPNKEFSGPSIIVVRGGYLAEILLHLTEIRELYPRAEIVLSPGIRGASSTQLIEEQNFNHVSIIGIDTFDGYWHKDQITKREQNGIPEYIHRSVTEMGIKLKEKLTN